MGLRNTSGEGTIRGFLEPKINFAAKGEAEWRTSSKRTSRVS